MTNPATQEESRAHSHAGRPYLDVQKLSLWYRDKRALADVDLSLDAGRILALIGPSGCGKTSFLACLNRLTDLIPGARVSGRVRLGHVEALDRGTDVTALRRRVGMIFQKPNPFPLSVRENLRLPLLECGMKDRHMIDAVIEGVLTDVGLWGEVKDRLEKPALALSGGQQQRLCIARALTLRPEALLMDEPCSALDPISSGVVEDLIAGFRRKYTVVMVTHNLAQARRVADDVAFFWLRNGSAGLVEHGAVRQIFDAPREDLTRAYIGGTRG
jgi:phosphate transport system ATP-binding protein